jgi:hypothetical protein
VTQRGAYKRSVYDVLGFENGMDPASPDTLCRRTMRRADIVSSAGIALPTTGKMIVVPVTLEAGDSVAGIAFVTGTTAAVTPTAGFAALYTNAGVLLAQSADFAATARAASTAYTAALAAAYTVKESGQYLLGLSITAGTMPTLLGSPVAPPVATGEASYARETTATYTGTAPATLPALTNRIDCPYLVCV